MKTGVLRTIGECIGLYYFHQTWMHANGAKDKEHAGGAQGPRGVVGYVYTQKHTDQENESVNHIRYMHTCDHIGTYLWSQKVYI